MKNRCINCESIIDDGLWFCSFTCAGYCCMFNLKTGWRTEEEAFNKLLDRYIENNSKDDLIRIEKMLMRPSKLKG